MYKQKSLLKILTATISLIITFFVWQQGLKDSLNRPSVAFDISQKEIEITELAMPAIPNNLRKIIANSPKEDMRNSLSQFSYNELNERSKLIWIILNGKDNNLDKSYFNGFEKTNYKNSAESLYKSYLDESYKPAAEIINGLKNDKYLFKLFTEKFNLNKEKTKTNKFAKLMLLKLIIIRTIPIFSILVGSILALIGIWKTFIAKTIHWSKYQPLNLNQLDMILLISGGFVVIGEIISPLISITLIDLFSGNLSFEISQSIKIFLGYLFMAIPPLYILYRQIRFINNGFSLKIDYFQFNYKPLRESVIQGIRGWIIIIPFVLLVSLLMNLLIENQAGSNPLLEIVLNNNNYLAFIILFFTTTIIAPLFEEIIFRGVLLPILSRDFGEIIGIIISSFVFALAHLSFTEFPPLFVLGIGLATTRLISGRLFSSVVMHSLWNGLTFLNLFLLRT
mgnify:CR=1 FL=1|tara:strand:- start:1746 stop:3098 length:1353 start_codon:yes stop_codon:yes gene_type:complete